MYKMNKKAQGLSLNMVAGAVIVLVVVVVLIIVFSGKISLFSMSISGCESKPGGACVAKDNCPGEDNSKWYYSQKIDFKCSKADEVCCYSNCKASGGFCESTCESIDDLGPADCTGSNRCCKKKQ
jgi:hypothetical protein